LIVPEESRPKHFKFPSFPKSLVRILIFKTSPENGIVLDPFMGSGTTAIVALEMKRKFLGVEVSKDFIDLSLQRIENRK
jgi:DNA modification methylase